MKLRRGPADRGHRARTARTPQIFRDIAASAWAELQGAARRAHRSRPRSRSAPARGELRVGFEGGEPFTLAGRDAARHEPVGRGAGPFARAARHRRPKRNVKIKDLRPVGNYAVRIVFDDGHDTGLFTWSYLQTLHTSARSAGRSISQRWP